MYKVWAGSGDDEEGVARALEAHLNEYAQDVVSVSYSVAQAHHVLAVYRPVLPQGAEGAAAVSVAEIIMEREG